MQTNLVPESKPKCRLSGVCIEDWGLLSYRDAEVRQLQYLEEIAAGKRQSTVVICQHPPVVTLGRATQAGDVFDWSGETYEVSRGGRATYHGPEQIVIYPLIDLKPFGSDIRRHLRNLEICVIEVLNQYGIKSEIRESETGIWVGDRKICSFGVACRQWVSYHGLALYVEASHIAYTGINPCGYKTETMISLNELTGKTWNKSELAIKLATRITSFYQY